MRMSKNAQATACEATATIVVPIFFIATIGGIELGDIGILPGALFCLAELGAGAFFGWLSIKIKAGKFLKRRRQKR